jgi:dipeptidyl aminopeptidase/acylaminoacyl peptidase
VDELFNKDIRSSKHYIASERLHDSFHEGSRGRVIDAIEVDTNVGAGITVFSGIVVDAHGASSCRLCSIDPATGTINILTLGPNTDRSPAISGDGTTVAFLSDQKVTGDFQLYLLDMFSHQVCPAPRVDGWVESLQWSSCGLRILLTVAGHGADVSSGQGGIKSRMLNNTSSWMPDVHTGNEEYQWRSVWIYDTVSGLTSKVSRDGLNIWEACWCGDTSIGAIVSDGPTEAHWYSATLNIIEIASGKAEEIYVSNDQLGCISISPRGSTVAFVEAVCSDRGVVAGDLLLIDLSQKQYVVNRIASNHVDITRVSWRNEQQIFLAGHRCAESVILEYDVVKMALEEYWSSSKISGVGRYISPSPVGKDKGDCIFISEGFTRAPELGRIKNGHYQTVIEFNNSVTESLDVLTDNIESITWCAPDGLEIQGWLLRPVGEGPYPLVMDIHGGPVWHWRPRWLVRSNLPTLMLLNMGYAIFLPNPRGSSGRGQDFARKVQGDLGGKDTDDFLSGLDYLVEEGVADPNRIGITGASYGGFMCSWLVTQDNRFAAAIPVAPVTHWTSKHLTTYIPAFDELFLNDSYKNAAGLYWKRSPVMYANKVCTPTLNICGALDRCTPPSQAMEFHHSLLENETISVLLTYPEEGHGIRKYPAVFDYAARVVSWFEKYMPP